MRILITGGTGFIGQRLCDMLHNNQLVLLSRKVQKVNHTYNVDIINSLSSLNNLNDFDAVINLAGAPILNGRWSKRKKQMIVSSRLDITQQLVDLINKSTTPPHSFISASAAGIYGDRQRKALMEQSLTINDSFTYQVCSQWETLALEAKTRVCLLRTAIVLGQGGMLGKMLPMFKQGLGTSLGNGEQFMPWIHIDDEVRAICFLLEHQTCIGAFNLCAPQSVTNKEFSQALASALKKPLRFSIPKWVLQLTLGEASHLLLDSQRMSPAKLLTANFKFNYPKLDIALRDVVNNDKVKHATKG